jgi:hypothetical protein
MSNLAIRIFPEPVRSLAFGSIVVGYTAIGTPLAFPSRLLVFQNLTDASVMVSWDGVNNHQPIGINGYMIMDITANKTNNGGAFAIHAGTQFYIKYLSGAPSVGSFYLSTYYGIGG